MNNKYATVKDGLGDRRTITTVVENDAASDIVRAVAICADQRPEELPPLNDAIDPDALDSLFSPTRRGTPRQGTITFPYADHQVVVTDSRHIAVEPLHKPD